MSLDLEQNAPFCSEHWKVLKRVMYNKTRSSQSNLEHNVLLELEHSPCINLPYRLAQRSFDFHFMAWHQIIPRPGHSILHFSGALASAGLHFKVRLISLMLMLVMILPTHRHLPISLQHD